MSVTYFDATTLKFFLFRNQSKHFSIPQYHILILAWRALVIFYGEAGPSPTTGHCET
jgi:hypothetical protein